MENNNFIHWDVAQLPELTDTYQPIGHEELLDIVAQELEVYNYTIIRRSVSQNTNGERIAAKFIVQRGEHDDMTMVRELAAYERPEHKIRVASFWMDRYEVTNARAFFTTSSIAPVTNLGSLWLGS